MNVKSATAGKSLLSSLGKAAFSKRGFGGRAFLFMLLALVCVVLGTSSWAQSTTYPRLKLYSDKENYNILPYARVIRESQKSLNAKEAMAMFRAGRSPASFTSGLARITGETHWVSFEIYSQSSIDSWVLSFGDQNHGRFGLPDEISIYNATTGEMLVDMRDIENGNKTQVGNLMGNAVPLVIKRGETVSILMRVTPNNYAPLIFPLRLQSSKQHIYQTEYWGWEPRSLELLFILMLGFYAASIILRRDFSVGLFAVFVILQYYSYSIENQAFYGGDGFAGLLKPLLVCMTAITGLFIAKEFLGQNRDTTLQDRLFMLVSAVCVMSMVFGMLILPSGSIIGIFMTFLPMLVVPLVAFMASLIDVRSDGYKVVAFAVGWFVALVANVITLAAVMDFVEASQFKLFAVWGGALIQNACFVLAIVIRQFQDDRERFHDALEKQEDNKTQTALGQTKAEAENARLLKLIKHEREVMNELREREIEQNTETRRARESAEEANRAKSAFLAVISHEIRTPMTGVLGMARLLLQEQLTKKQKDYAQTIKDSGEAMVSLLNDILDFEKIEGNHLDLEMVDFDLVRVLNGVVTLMSGHASAKNIKLEHDIDPAVPPIVIGDSVRLRQILLNLVGNAIKFTETGGVTLIVKRQQDAAHKGTDKQKILFAIKDTGIGISAEAKKNLFNPFSQADSSITRKFGGTGLGLAISQRLVEAMGSKIEIDSVEGEGSTFFFALSMERGDEKRAEDTENTNASIGRAAPSDENAKSILIVEDNEVNQKLLTELLRRFGHKSMVAGSGEDGLELLRDHHFDMVFMDVHLPGISGMGATKQIRALKDHKKASVPVIALTGNIANEDIAACYAANMNAYLSKPIDPVLLEKTIGNIIDGKLDNPVELQDMDDKQEAKAPQKDVAAVVDYQEQQAEQQSVQPQSTQSQPPIFKEPEESDLLSPPAADHDKEGRDDKASDDKGSDDGISPPKAAANPVPDDMSPLRAMAMELENFDFDADDFDLEEDSFAAAIEIGEAQDKSKVNGFESTDVLDPSILDTLRKSIGHDKLEDMISEMFMKIDELSKSMKAAASENDRQAFLSRTHELKGMSANFGLLQIKVLLLETEIALKNGENLDFNEMLANLDAAEEAAKSALQRWVGASAELQ